MKARYWLLLVALVYLALVVLHEHNMLPWDHSITDPRTYEFVETECTTSDADGAPEHESPDYVAVPLYTITCTRVEYDLIPTSKEAQIAEEHQYDERW